MCDRVVAVLYQTVTKMYKQILQLINFSQITNMFTVIVFINNYAGLLPKRDMKWSARDNINVVFI